MTDRSGPPFRADHVGSLLRRKNLLDARARHAAGEIDDAELRGIEDEAIAEVVRMQKDVGPHAPYGVRGVGERPTISSGVKLRRVPIRPEHITGT
jgi:methionine synthase II (cobalamin-independent)